MITSKQFYKKLGVKGLAERKKEKWTRKELVYIKKLLNKNQKILDLGCGYGRFTIPLAKSGYNIEGIDISPNFIKEARKRANKQRLNINFKIGDMRKLPYNQESFNIIICMWSAFSELYKESDQIKSLKEMLRVLTKEGKAIIEMPLPYNKSLKTDNDKRKTAGKIITGEINGIKAMPMYHQDRNSLRKLMKKLKIKKFNIFIDKFGGRDRLFLQFWKK